AELLSASWPPTGAPEGEGPWQHAPPDYYFAFRGAPPLTGQLLLSPRPAQFQARCQSDVYLGGSRGALRTRLTVQPATGSPDHVDLVLSAPLAGPWKVRSESPGTRVAAVTRLPAPRATAALLALAPHDALQALSVLATQPGSERWRVRFAEP